MKRAEEMSLEELLRQLPSNVQLRKQRDGALVIEEVHRPWPRKVRAAYAREVRKTQTARRVSRTAELSLAGKVAREIAVEIAAEEGVEPFSIATVKDWRSKARKAGLLPAKG